MVAMVDDEEESEGTEASLDELLAKRAEEKADEEEDDALDLTRGEEGPESLGTIKVVPQQADEFTCRNCFLVKHRSQLSDKKKMICRDCA
ncbi:MAG: hypothetical protein NVSMB57_04950 [Actinomycetota bacterium]